MDRGVHADILVSWGGGGAWGIKAIIIKVDGRSQSRSLTDCVVDIQARLRIRTNGLDYGEH